MVNLKILDQIRLDYLSFVMYLAQPSSLDMLVLVGKVSCAAWCAAQ